MIDSSTPGEEVRIRPARPDDRDRVLEFCRHTWEFGDYIDRVWDRWLADPESDLLVAVDSDDRPIGLGQARLVAGEEGWLEGLRVDPARRLRGVARRLTQAAREAAERRGARTIRFATLTTNLPIHHLSPQLGFRRVAGFAFWRSPAQSWDGPRFEIARADLDRAANVVARRATVQALDGLIAAGWSYARPSGATLTRWLTAGPDRLLQLDLNRVDPVYAWVEPAPPESPLAVTWLAADLNDLTLAGQALRDHAARRGHPLVEIRLPDQAGFEAPIRAAGFELRPDPGFYLYSYSSVDPGPTPNDSPEF